jgi:ppGpp synthetase/RelA/SpoT-type nucleotidyltranferase
MILDSKISSKYKLYLPYFEFIQGTLDQTLMNYAKKHLFAYTSRVKKLDSISEKIETGRYSSWVEIDDFIGCILIVPNLSYEEEVIDFLKNAFIEINLRKKGSTFKNFDTFRFDSTRFIGKLIPPNQEVSEDIYDIKFEIQIRSAFEHAWSVTTHDLTYKSKNIDWKVLRLAAQLKASVEQLDMIALSAKDVNKQITSYKWPEIDIKIKILNFLKENFENGKIPNEIAPKDYSRVVDNLFSLIKKKLSVWQPRKVSRELNKIFKNIDTELSILNSKGFPMSLSLFQVVFGIFLKYKVIDLEDVSKTTFYKSDTFLTVFPELKELKLNEFEI